MPITVKQLIEALGQYPENSPVYFSENLMTNDLKPITDVAWGDDDTGEAAIITADTNPTGEAATERFA